MYQGCVASDRCRVTWRVAVDCMRPAMLFSTVAITANTRLSSIGPRIPRPLSTRRPTRVATRHVHLHDVGAPRGRGGRGVVEEVGGRSAPGDAVADRVGDQVPHVAAVGQYGA